MCKAYYEITAIGQNVFWVKKQARFYAASREFHYKGLDASAVVENMHTVRIELECNNLTWVVGCILRST